MSTDSATPASPAAATGKQAGQTATAQKRCPWPVRAYKVSQRAFGKLRVGLEALHDGFWLGVLDKPLLDAAGEQYYDDRPLYQDFEYNRRGFFDWERQMVERYFPPTGRLLVTSAGGGREVLAFHKCGYQVDAAECHAGFVTFANVFLAVEQVPCEVQLVPPDEVPPGDERYDAIVVGWSAYMLIQGRARRIAFLRELKPRLNPGAPLLLSFFTRDGDTPYFRLIHRLANGLRTLRRREAVDLGDALTPNYVHYFREAELAAELQAAGFELLYFGDTDYGHAVARAT